MNPHGLPYAPESCAGSQEGTREALTGENAGQPLSSEITNPGCRPREPIGKAIRYDGVKQRVVYRPCGVRDPEHAWTLYV